MCLCCLKCCYQNASMIKVNKSFLLLTSIILFFTIITTGIRSAETSRFKKDLQLIEYFENQTDYSNQETFNNINIRKLRSYTIINGKKIANPKEEINYVSLFKKWKKTELILNLIRFILTIPLFILSLYIFIIRIKILDLVQNILFKITILSIICILLIILLLIYTFIIFYCRGMTLITDDDLGYFNIEKTTNFASATVWNMVFDIIIIVFLSICINFTYKIYYNSKYCKGKNIINKEGKVVQVFQVNPYNNNKNGFIIEEQKGQYIESNQIPIIYSQNIQYSNPNEEGNENDTNVIDKNKNSFSEK